MSGSDSVSSSLRLYSYRWGELPPTVAGGMAQAWPVAGSWWEAILQSRGLRLGTGGGKDTSNKGIGGAMVSGGNGQRNDLNHNLNPNDNNEFSGSLRVIAKFLKTD
ncbi:hypothetical protein FB451DRAFT_1198416 [Mycena latifolia]|nr:hypothetical protein FB451DRAFT_1198416 [Mycena latifolia]